MGAILNDNTIPQLRCAIVAGSANNQLEELRHGEELHQRDILYAPDFVINAGGLINVASELGTSNPLQVPNKVAAIYDTIYHIVTISKTKNIPTYIAAQRLALSRIEQHKHHPSPKNPPLEVAA
jgi:leucine dehydrogenase